MLKVSNQIFKLEELSVSPINIFLYVPPIVWKGDSVGHVGQNDLFFWVLEGECFLSIDSESYIIRPGQLAYLPKGKRRAYTHASEKFTMYEMVFSAKANGEELMEVLGLTEENYVVDVPDVDKMSRLFESSHRKELFKNPLYDVGWCANIMSIIKIYAEERQKLNGKDARIFKPVLEYMSKNMASPITTSDLASIVHMQTTYFIRRFTRQYGLPPISYLNRMRIYKAMGMLAETDHAIDSIAREVGITDSSYFARVFKKYCSLTPSEYRCEFRNF